MSHWYRTTTLITSTTTTPTLAPVTRHTPTITTSATTTYIVVIQTSIPHILRWPTMLHPPFQLAMVPFTLQHGVIIQVSHASHTVGFAALVRLARVVSVPALEVGPLEVEYGSVVVGRR